MTREAIGGGAQFVIWPESSTPFNFERSCARAEPIRRLAREAHVHAAVGSDQIEHLAPRAGRRAAASALLQLRVPRPAGRHDRRRLPEDAPRAVRRVRAAQALLFFAAPLVEAVSDFSPATTATLLPVGGHMVSTAICYEVVYPDLVRRSCASGSELLTTITNDAWFGRTSAPYQHFEQASMRAIEEGPLSRARRQHRHQRHRRSVRPRAAAADIFAAAVIVGDAAVPHTARTIYSAHRRRCRLYASVALTLAALLARRRVVRDRIDMT